MKKKRILLIEDEIVENYRPIMKLEEHYDLTIAGSVYETHDFIKQITTKRVSFDLIILDIMMAPRPYTLKETDDGLLTGWKLYEDKLKGLNIPIVPWTNNDINKKWGDNVKEVVIKNHDDSQLIKIIENNIN